MVKVRSQMKRSKGGESSTSSCLGVKVVTMLPYLAAYLAKYVAVPKLTGSLILLSFFYSYGRRI